MLREAHEGGLGVCGTMHANLEAMRGNHGTSLGSRVTARCCLFKRGGTHFFPR